MTESRPRADTGSDSTQAKQFQRVMYFAPISKLSHGASWFQREDRAGVMCAAEHRRAVESVV
jgi:hypothetical protein